VAIKAGDSIGGGIEVQEADGATAEQGDK